MKKNLMLSFNEDPETEKILMDSPASVFETDTVLLILGRKSQAQLAKSYDTSQSTIAAKKKELMYKYSIAYLSIAKDIKTEDLDYLTKFRKTKDNPHYTDGIIDIDARMIRRFSSHLPSLTDDEITRLILELRCFAISQESDDDEPSFLYEDHLMHG